jgi:nucleotide-binding universal stress UspA family protein
MNTLTSILVHADASPQTATRVQAAAALGRAHGAGVQALYAVLPVYMQYPYSLSLSAEAVSMLQQAEDERSTRARTLFDKAASSAAMPVGWSVAAGDPVAAFTRAATCSDLVVLGQHDPDNELRADVPSDFVASVVIDSGRPALVLPHHHQGGDIGRVVLLAWKPTREAAHALAGALPLLRAADKVHVASWSEDDVEATSGDDRADIERYLRGHGIAAEVHGYGPASREVGEYLLSLASDVGADLLVMGCYGHGRMREWVLGGATRSVLRSMTLPVLMAH